MLRVVFFIMVLFVLGGCRTVRPSTERIHTVKDSTWTTVKYNKKDTTITIPGELSYISIPMDQLSETPVEKVSGRAKATVKRFGDNVLVTCECAEYKQRIEYLETEITHLQKIIELQKEIRTEPYPYVPWYVKTLAWIGGLSLIAIAAILIKKLLLK